MSLNTKAVLMYLRISVWTARKYDKKISEEIEYKYDASEAGRYNKSLIAREHLKEIEKSCNQARTYYYENTLPWSDDGVRLLPTDNYMDYMKGMRAIKDDFEKAVSIFIYEYPTLREDAKIRLKAMYNDTDYPDEDKIKSKFGFETKTLPVPNADDFRVSLMDEEVEEIKESLRKQVEMEEATAMGDLWGRLYKVVQHMTTTLSEPKNKFKNSLVNNITTLCDLLPKLNFSGDQKLTEATEEIKRKLIINDPQTLRDNSEIRTQTAIDAQKILNKMRQYLPAN